mmetsp:Transcript_97061/g.261054  ORF Transcript_97061/g.261054 Transcript_97061/m.261054 type:complete len:106 (-) Transcript_97061:234-551(-)
MSHSGLRLGIGEALAHMNFTGRGCCLLHIGAMTLHRATKDMLCDPCNRAWMPKKTIGSAGFAALCMRRMARQMMTQTSLQLALQTRGHPRSGSSGATFAVRWTGR